MWLAVAFLHLHSWATDIWRIWASAWTPWKMTGWTFCVRSWWSRLVSSRTLSKFPLLLGINSTIWGPEVLECQERWYHKLVLGSTEAHSFQWTPCVSWCVDTAVSMGRKEKVFWTGALWKDLWDSRTRLISKTSLLFRTSCTRLIFSYSFCLWGGGGGG